MDTTGAVDITAGRQLEKCLLRMKPAPDHFFGLIRKCHKCSPLHTIPESLIALLKP